MKYNRSLKRFGQNRYEYTYYVDKEKCIMFRFVEDEKNKHKKQELLKLKVSNAT
jgi:hypothetical protein